MATQSVTMRGVSSRQIRPAAKVRACPRKARRFHGQSFTLYSIHDIRMVVTIVVACIYRMSTRCYADGSGSIDEALENHIRFTRSALTNISCNSRSLVASGVPRCP